MAIQEKKQTNPASSGSLGAFFEARVQTAFVIFMLTSRIAPCLPSWPIQKIKLQGRYAGFNTDDFIVCTKDPNSDREAKLLVQIKHKVSITDENSIFREVIQAAWNDFNNPDIFNTDTDVIGLITASTNTDLRTILDWARHSDDENEFHTKIDMERFSSENKRKIFKAFKAQLQKANGEHELSDHQLWDFLKHFHYFGYDLDSEDSSIYQLILSLIAQYSSEDPSAIWNKVCDEVQKFNPDAGTLSLNTIPKEISESFNTKINTHFAQDLKKLREHGKYILKGIRSEIGGFHIKRPELLTQLIESSEENNFVILLGERGCGKSSLIQEFAENLNEKEIIFCLRTEDLNKPHLDNVFSAIGLESSIGDLKNGLALMPKKYLLIESLEKLLELENKNAFVDLIHFIQSHSEWTIIASCREYALQQIAFTFLQPNSVKYETLLIQGFSEDDITRLCAKYEILKPFADNLKLKPLLKNPFFSDLAYRVMSAGKIFPKSAGEREFRAAVWSEIISKNSDRVNGMPLKRREAFIGISVKRAKKMVYEIDGPEFDAEALQKLEADDLIHCGTSNYRFRPAHDVFEDLALVQYIEDTFQSQFTDTKTFLDLIGHEHAMNRAFRLWINQKLKDNENIKPLIQSILTDTEIEKIWQDETITALLQADNPAEFLSEFTEILFENEAILLQRFCFILRIACKIPNQKILNNLGNNTKLDKYLTYAIFLKPYGSGWDAIIHFLLTEKQRISEKLLPHIILTLSEWADQIDINDNPPLNAREAGLLSLYLLQNIKNSYEHKDERIKLLGVIIRVVPAIQKEFIEMLEIDLFQSENTNGRLYYIDELVDFMLSKRDTIFLCKYIPDTVIKVAWHEWMINDVKGGLEEEGYYHVNDIEESFGLNGRKTHFDFSPPSGERGPFAFLLRFHPKKGLDFILELLNRTAEKYAHSELNDPKKYSALPKEMVSPEVREVELILNDDTRIKQYCSERLWGGYRGHSMLPEVLECALMALENWMINFVTIIDDPALINTYFYKILRKSNSVMPTAILASVSTAFPEKLGIIVLPLLRTPELYDMDIKRKIHEMGKNEINFFNLSRDPYADIYCNERREAALRSWRKQDLEGLVLQLQFTDQRDRIFAVIDELRSTAENNETWRFRFHRIDSRNLKPEIDEEKHEIVLTPLHLETDLVEIQEETQIKQSLYNRFFSIFNWADKIWKNEQFDTDYDPKWQDIFEETENLFDLVKESIENKSSEQLPINLEFCLGRLTKAAALFIRDHHSEIEWEKLDWCIDLVTFAVRSPADFNEKIANYDGTDFNGVEAAATILPILFDYCSDVGEIQIIKEIHAIALTHVNINVRLAAANGIRNYLWERDPQFAQNLFIGTIQYSHLNVIKREQYYSGNGSDEWLSDFRDQLVQGTERSTDIDQISFQSHDSGFLLSPCLMIPTALTESIHISFLIRMFTLFEGVECARYSHNSNYIDTNNIARYAETSVKFGKLYANQLFFTSDITAQNTLIEIIKNGCKNAPDLIHLIFLYMQINADNTGNLDKFWWFWNEIANNTQKIAIDMVKEKSRYNKSHENQRKLIRNMLFTSVNSENFDYERKNMIIGKKSIEEFVINAGMNPDVFEAMTRLMFYYPDLFFESGLRILSQHQNNANNTQLLTENGRLYLEMCFNQFFHEESVSMSKEQYHSCQLLLDALVNTGSSGAYYLREYMIQSLKIKNYD